MKQTTIELSKFPAMKKSTVIDGLIDIARYLEDHSETGIANGMILHAIALLDDCFLIRKGLVLQVICFAVGCLIGAVLLNIL